MFIISKLKTCLCLILLFALTASMAIAGSPEWAWDQGSYEQDGTVTMDGEDYSINPTGHQSLTGKSIRQPPTVIVQTTSDGGGGRFCTLRLQTVISEETHIARPRSERGM
jgi:hypothetical protein